MRGVMGRWALLTAAVFLVLAPGRAFADSAKSFTLVPSVTTVQAGVPITVTVTARKANGDVEPNYNKTVTLSSNDANAFFSPVSHTYVPGTDLGVFTFTVIYRTTGATRNIVATDNDVPTATTGSFSPIVVTAGTANALVYTVQRASTTTN
ncbi:MAG: hypothetical protein ACAI25_02965, partial [Planctomycetota bacterium]